MITALVREVPESINDCELTFLERQPIDLATARLQHAQYVALLTSLGVQVRYLPPLPRSPDSVFVEDTALVLDEVAVLLRPGAGIRRAEVESTGEALRPHRKVVALDAPATIDGGDIIVLGRQIFVGSTTRSNRAGAAALQDAVAEHGYLVRSIPITDCLHLKSAATAIGDAAVLANPAWVDPEAFGVDETVLIDPGEPEGANAVRLGDVLIHAAEFPATRRRLEEAGYEVRSVPASELAKAEGAVTCCSLLFVSG